MRLSTGLIFILFIDLIHAEPFRIHGRVVDKETAIPLSYCNISILNSSRGTTTNSDGFYSIKCHDPNITIRFQYMGYESQIHALRLASPDTMLDIYLRPIVLEFSPLSIISDRRTDAERLILRASQKKNHFRDLLRKYSCYSYTKTSYRSKEKMDVYGALLETFSEIYFQRPGSYKEIVRSQRQSANMPRSINYLTGDTFLDINSDRILLGNKKIIGPTAADAIQYYHFELKDTLYEDRNRLIQIAFTPKHDDLPLMEGALILSETNYLIKEIDARLNPACDYDFFKSIKIIQQYQSLSDSLYVPSYSKRESLLEIGIPKYPVLVLTKENWRENYAINSDAELPNNSDEQVTIERAVDFSQVPMLIPPLTISEKKGYALIDSLVTHNRTVAAMTKGVKLLDLYESVKETPVSQFSDFFRFNRVEGPYLGVAINTERMAYPVSIYSGIGYGFSDSKAKYSVTPRIVHSINAWEMMASFSNYHRLDYTDTYKFYPVWLNTFSSLFSRNDYFDYYYSKGNKIDLSFSKNFSEFSVGLFRERHTQANRHVSKSLTGQTFRSNMTVSEGGLTGYTLGMKFSNAAYRKSSLFNKFVPHQRFWEVEFLYEAGLQYWDGDFSYNKFSLSTRMRQNPIPRILCDMVSNLCWTSAEAPIQKKAALTSGNVYYDQFKAFSTLRPNALCGRYKYEIFTEINFTNLFFSTFNKVCKTHLDYEVSMIMNHGWAGNSLDMDVIKNDSYSEIGFGVNKILGILRFEFIWGINPIKGATPFVFNVKVVDFDIF